MTNIYLSTSIPYVNSEPHVGFALELVQGDALARYWRSRGKQVHFQGGTDDNSLKNVRAAEEASVPVDELVVRNAGRFRHLSEALDVSFDDFVSTSQDTRHPQAVENLWKACASSGDIYRKTYTGLYCVGCEQFYTESELVDGCCPEHSTRPEDISEQNWFFRLSKYRDQLLALIESGDLKIVPESKRNEVLATLRAGVDDISISRSATRAKGWGIPVPGDPTEVIYVWIDALANYLTGVGYGTNDAKYDQLWSSAEDRVHLLGKGITRFHAIYWPAILLSAGIPLPSKLLVHGYLTIDGKKIGKSAGNGIDPAPLVARYGQDAVRWYLLRHQKSDADGDFSEERLIEAHNADLSNQLGNLFSRALGIARRAGLQELPLKPDTSNEVWKQAIALEENVGAALERFAIHDALDSVVELLSEANRYFTTSEPWKLVRQTDSNREAVNGLKDILGTVFGVVEIVALTLAPFIPDGSERLREALREGREVSVFPKIAPISG